MMNLIEQLKAHEGFESNYYKCTAQKKTIGYGRNVENNPFSEDELKVLGRTEFDDQPMTEEEAELLLVNDIERVKKDIQHKLKWNELSKPRQAVCINMAFNLGVAGFFNFRNMILALDDCYYERAAREMLDSLWAKQVKGRAEQLATQMYTGEWQ